MEKEPDVLFEIVPRKRVGKYPNIDYVECPAAEASEFVLYRTTREISRYHFAEYSSLRIAKAQATKAAKSWRFGHVVKIVGPKE